VLIFICTIRKKPDYFYIIIQLIYYTYNKIALQHISLPPVVQSCVHFLHAWRLLTPTWLLNSDICFALPTITDEAKNWIEHPFCNISKIKVALTNCRLFRKRSIYVNIIIMIYNSSMQQQCSWQTLEMKRNNFYGNS